jgi:leukotriene-A4 hydrolase
MKAAIGLIVFGLMAGMLLNYYPITTRNDRRLYMDDEIIDNSTNANMDEVTTKHLHLDLNLDFDKKIANGSVTLTMNSLVDNLESIKLDARYLNINDVRFENGDHLDFWFTEPNPMIGPGLNIDVNGLVNKNDTFDIVVDYETTSEGLSLNWLEPAQTFGGKYPYVYTHCEAIDCRTLIPLQDTPSVKATYSARIYSPKDIKVHMSALTLDEKVQGDIRITDFELDVPIASYLIALAAGNLEYRKIGRNTGVITEPEFIEQCVKELSGLQRPLDIAGGFLTAYEWGNYTVLVLPPSFPFGGMENPLLTFASPTIIVGDKSQVGVATHEIAHSWTGNLVTNRNWENFWLNEGFTVYLERHITFLQKGYDAYLISAFLGNASLYNAMANFGFNSTFSSLSPDYQGANPYDTFSEVPYEKGFQFLAHIESLIGRNKMELFLKIWVAKFKHQSVVWQQFKEEFEYFLKAYFPSKKESILAQIDWHTWIFVPGPPPVQLKFSSPQLDLFKELAANYIKLGGKGRPENYEKFFGYFSNLRCVFLSELLDQSNSITIPILEQIDSDYNLTETIDPEQKAIWFQLGIMNNYTTVLPNTDEFLGSVGRQKYLLPLYRALNVYNHTYALETFENHQALYHPVALKNIKAILGI